MLSFLIYEKFVLIGDNSCILGLVYDFPVN